jgi:hypothetical protein
VKEHFSLCFKLTSKEHVFEHSHLCASFLHSSLNSLFRSTILPFWNLYSLALSTTWSISSLLCNSSLTLSWIHAYAHSWFLNPFRLNDTSFFAACLPFHLKKQKMSFLRYILNFFYRLHWDFLLETLKGRGFGRRWIEWITNV